MPGSARPLSRFVPPNGQDQSGEVSIEKWWTEHFRHSCDLVRPDAYFFTLYFYFTKWARFTKPTFELFYLVVNE
jgi:hypothetical protein